MSDYHLLKNALSIGPAKEAAIYFDFVVPFDLNTGITHYEDDHSIYGDPDQDLIIESLMPNVGDATSFYRGYTGTINAFWSIVAIRKWHHEHGSTDGFLDQDKAYLNFIDEHMGMALKMSLSSAVKKMTSDLEFTNVRSEIVQMLNSGLNSLDKDGYSEWLNDVHGQDAPTYDAKPSRTASVLAILHDIALVDADKLSWKQILEIRRDKNSLRALRDLRLFLYKEAAELEKDALTDQINSHYDQYCDAVKNWKLETIKKPLSMMVSKEGLGLTSLGAIGSFLLTGIPVDPLSAITAAKAALASGAALNVAGGGALSLHDSYMERDKLSAAAGSEVRYLAYLNKRTGKRSE